MPQFLCREAVSGVAFRTAAVAAPVAVHTASSTPSSVSVNRGISACKNHTDVSRTQTVWQRDDALPQSISDPGPRWWCDTRSIAGSATRIISRSAAEASEGVLAESRAPRCSWKSNLATRQKRAMASAAPRRRVGSSKPFTSSPTSRYAPSWCQAAHSMLSNCSRSFLSREVAASPFTLPTSSGRLTAALHPKVSSNAQTPLQHLQRLASLQLDCCGLSGHHAHRRLPLVGLTVQSCLRVSALTSETEPTTLASASLAAAAFGSPSSGGPLASSRSGGAMADRWLCTAGPARPR